MKYVKVLKFNEYSVFEVIEEYEKTIKCKMTNCENGYIIIGKNNVVKEADTIEELVDEFVVASKTNHFHTLYATDTYSLTRVASDIINMRDKYDIYGAIWTSKGLIYVAKLNEKGELELI